MVDRECDRCGAPITSDNRTTIKLGFSEYVSCTPCHEILVSQFEKGPCGSPGPTIALPLGGETHTWCSLSPDHDGPHQTFSPSADLIIHWYPSDTLFVAKPTDRCGASIIVSGGPNPSDRLVASCGRPSGHGPFHEAKHPSPDMDQVIMWEAREGRAFDHHRDQGVSP